jgi:hypothetical protein
MSNKGAYVCIYKDGGTKPLNHKMRPREDVLRTKPLHISIRLPHFHLQHISSRVAILFIKTLTVLARDTFHERLAFWAC